MLELMVFDVAGTTVYDGDDAVARCVCEAVGAAAPALPLEAVDPVMGMPKPLAIRVLLEQATGDVPTDDLAESVYNDFVRRMCEHYAHAPDIRPMDGAERVFAQLRERGIQVGLDTGFSRPVLDIVLDRLGWRNGVIDDSVTSDEVDNGRPSPDMIHALMGSAGITDPRRVGKIGDSVSDIEQGIAAECGFVAAMLGQRTEPVMDRFPNVRGVRSLAELPGLIDQLAGAGAAR